MFNFWASVEDGQPILKQHWMNASSLNSIMIQSIFCCTGGVESTVWERILSHSRLSPTQTERVVAPERVLKRVNSGCREGCSRGGGVGGDVTNLDYIVQRCALFVLAKHVETVTAQMIETQ